MSVDSILRDSLVPKCLRRDTEQVIKSQEIALGPRGRGEGNSNRQVTEVCHFHV